jgi:hypothetical protein
LFSSLFRENNFLRGKTSRQFWVFDPKKESLMRDRAQRRKVGKPQSVALYCYFWGHIQLEQEDNEAVPGEDPQITFHLLNHTEASDQCHKVM